MDAWQERAYREGYDAANMDTELNEYPEILLEAFYNVFKKDGRSYYLGAAEAYRERLQERTGVLLQ